MQVVCCLCNKTKGNEGWGRDAVQENRLLSHGYCPDCYRKTLQQIHSTPVEARDRKCVKSKRV